MPVVGWLGSGSAEPLLVAALHRGLREAGFIDRQNVALEYRWANGQYERLPAQAAELVELRVAVIVAGAPPAAHAAKAATSTIPVVFSLGTDHDQPALHVRILPTTCRNHRLGASSGKR